MSDTKKAALLLICWAVLVFIGLLVVPDPKYGMTLIGAATAGLALIVYSSWLIERTEKRMKRYIKAANERLRQ